ncbi:BTAD domain-containing putative transcriptional regulator [Streptomyces sp. DT117]|uniref:BTAD domain-containing putative transcriptional regulator n=1 Tax=Streptomyces sp. DT117 TaxID=3393422 RepID=UPI003CE80240
MEVVGAGGVVGLGGTKQRATLGYLLLQANHVVATSRLLNALWGVDQAPATARKILQNAVYGLRGALSGSGDTGGSPSASLLTQAPGYMMRVEPARVDLHLFHTWVSMGRERQAKGEPQAAARLLSDALGLWRGPVLADLVETGIEWPELAALRSVRLDAAEDFVDAQLACGRHHAVLAELETMVQSEPLRERSCGQLMLALYRCGRQADALHAYRHVRDALVENLGLEPGRDLQQLQRAILAQDPSLSLDTEGGRGAVAGDLARQPLRTEPALEPAPAPAPVSVSPAPSASPAAAVAGSWERGGRDSVPDAAVAPRGLRDPEPSAEGTPGGGDAFGPDPAHGIGAGDGGGGSGSVDAGAGTDDDADGGSFPVAGADRRQVSVVLIRTRLASAPGRRARAAHDELLDGTAEVVREQIEQNGGSVMASFGSVTLGLFGLHESRGDDTRRAVQAALAVREVFDMCPEAEAAGVTIAVHACVNVGEVLLRHRGQEGQPTVVGTTLDESQALLAEVRAGEVRVSDAVRRATEKTLRYAPAHPASGSWQVLGEREPQPAHGMYNAARTFELDVLQGLVNRTLHRSVPQLVTVLGDAGVGKSDLLGDLGHWVTDRPDAPQFLIGHTPAQPTGHPLRAQAQILAAYCGTGLQDPPAARYDALVRRLREVLPPRVKARLLSRLSPLLAPGQGGGGSHTPYSRAEALEAWSELFRRAAQHKPLVLCIDDLDRAEDPVLDTVEELAESTRSGALFVVAAAGPGLLLRRPSWAGGKSHATTVTLDRPVRTTGEQLAELLLTAARNDRPQSVYGG